MRFDHETNARRLAMLQTDTTEAKHHVHTLTTERPEALYKRTTDTATRRRLQAAVVDQCRAKAASMARALVPRAFHQHLPDAEQACLIGVLVALEKYDDAISGPDRGKKDFWGFAHPHVRNELQKWLDVGIYWRKAPNRGKSPTRVAARAEARLQRQVISLDAPVNAHDETDSTFASTVADRGAPVDELAADAEAKALIGEFASSLTEDEREMLFSDVSAKTRSSRHYLSLVERATAFVRGSETGEYRSAVRGYSDTIRP